VLSPSNPPQESTGMSGGLKLVLGWSSGGGRVISPPGSPPAPGAALRITWLGPSSSQLLSGSKAQQIIAESVLVS
jgi:hypothetical protein